MRAFARFGVFGTTTVMLASAVLAQGPRGADILTPAAVADSQAVLKDLDQRVRSNKTDADAWYRLGMVAWVLSDRAKAPNPPRGLDANKLGRMADTSLRIAAQLAPTKAHYKLMVGRYLLTTGLAVSRSASAGFFEQALDLARKNADTLQIAEAAIEVGRTRWRKFDALVNRRIETTQGAAISTIEGAMQPGPADPDLGIDAPMFNMKAVREALERGTMALPPDVTGEADYQKAGEFFREAYAALPSHARAFRSVAMVLAERDNWSELEIFSHNHLKQSPWDAWGWLTLGLAAHRLGNTTVAATAFDSAFSYLSPSERQRLDRISRVRPRGDSGKMVAGTEAERASLGRFYWLVSDPLWSRPGNESRVEFFSRITFAELRWTVDELHVLGADTDRGEVYIRYGPPDIQAAVGPDPSQGNGTVSTIWVYRSGLLFSFQGTPGFGTAFTPVNELSSTTAHFNNSPVRWDNVASIHVDSVPTQVARFRARGDSIDMYMAAQPPVDSIRKYSDVATIKGYAWLLSDRLAVVFRDSTVLSAKGSHGWTRRVTPGTYIYRAEAGSDATLRGGRSTVIVDASGSSASGFTSAGFGMSDVLFATSAEPTSGAAKRWTDLTIAPTAGAVLRSGQLALVWENYEFGQRDGSAQYEVVVTLNRTKSAAGKLAAGIVGALASAARIDQNDDRVAMTLTRSQPYAPAFVDHITLSLGETPRGNYTISVQVTDKITGKSVTRTRNLLIRE